MGMFVVLILLLAVAWGLADYQLSRLPERPPAPPPVVPSAAKSPAPAEPPPDSPTAIAPEAAPAAAVASAIADPTRLNPVDSTPATDRSGE